MAPPRAVSPSPSPTICGIPIRYVGTGETIEDLVPFSADEYVDALFEEKW